MRENDTESVADRVRAFWLRLGAGVRRGTTTFEVAAFERLHGLTLPKSVAAFYQVVDGMEDDDEVFTAWPLLGLGTVPVLVAPRGGIPDYRRICDSLPSANDYFAFGECMLWSQVLAVRLRPATVGTPVVCISGSTHREVAPSFEAFWEAYLQDANAVLSL